MSDQDIIRALKDVVARHTPPAPAPAQQLSLELQARDRWRIRILATVTALLWLCGIAALLYMIFWFNRFIILSSTRFDGPNAPAGYESWRAGEEWHAQRELHHSLEACMAAVPMLLVAALCTVWLVLMSRRATLNQINISLVEISQQLQEMRQLAGAASRSAGGS